LPHFGLMDARALGPERAALQRARLHVRGGKRRLQATTQELLDDRAVDAAGILEGVESVLTELGVLPFDERELPPEDPGTF